MKLITPVRTFNTGRMYASDGQRISYALAETERQLRMVVFIDHARGIHGVIDLHFGNLDLLTDGWVLRAYDDFHYRHGNYDVIELLRAAIRTQEGR